LLPFQLLFLPHTVVVFFFSFFSFSLSYSLAERSLYVSLSFCLYLQQLEELEKKKVFRLKEITAPFVHGSTYSLSLWPKP
jgi:hypothetical protein